MFDYKYLIISLFLFYNFHLISSCGCYGSTTCTPNGNQCNYQLNESCLCDCCPACRTCKQFLEFNCLAHQFITHFSLSTNQSDIIAKINESIIPNYIIDQTNGERIRYPWDPCLRRSLPNGVYLTSNNEGQYKLVGIPREKLEKTSFEILFKGPVNLLILVNLTISII